MPHLLQLHREQFNNSIELFSYALIVYLFRLQILVYLTITNICFH